jgi:hypothetical protein
MGREAGIKGDHPPTTVATGKINRSAGKKPSAAGSNAVHVGKKSAKVNVLTSSSALIGTLSSICHPAFVQKVRKMALKYASNGPTTALTDALKSMVLNYRFLVAAAGSISDGGGGCDADALPSDSNKSLDFEDSFSSLLCAGSVARWSSGVLTDAHFTVQILSISASGAGGLHGTEYVISDGNKKVSAKAFVTLQGRLAAIGPFGVAKIQGCLVQAGFDLDPDTDWVLIKSVQPPHVANPGVEISSPTHISQGQQVPKLYHVDGNTSSG